MDPTEKYCPKHKALHPINKTYLPDHTEKTAARGYDSKWQKARKRFLETHPLCEICKKNGKFTKATVVDHIIPHKGNMKLFWDTDNWQALCKPCHDKKTLTEDVQRNRVYSY